MMDSHLLVVSGVNQPAMRMRMVGENQDESKRPIERCRTRQGTLPKPSKTIQDLTRDIKKYRPVHTQNLPSKEEPTSLKHAESVRNATVTHHSTNSITTRKTI